MSLPTVVFSVPTSPFPPVALGFFGLGTGYLIYGPQELFGFGVGMWGIWMPWFAIGWNRLRQVDPRVNVGMAVAFLVISILGIVVFFKAGNQAVGGLFIGLACVYVSDIFASLGASAPGLSRMGTRLLGFFHTGVGVYLMYLTFATVLDVVFKYTLPRGETCAGRLTF